MRRVAVAGVMALAVLVLGGAPAALAQTATTSTIHVEVVITVEAGPAQQRSFAARCSDARQVFAEQLSFVVGRTGTPSGATTFTYRLSGSAQAGVHYDPLPGSGTIPAGSDSVTIDVVPRPTELGALVDLTLEVTGASAIVPVPRPSARIQFASPPSPGPVECREPLARTGPTAPMTKGWTWAALLVASGALMLAVVGHEPRGAARASGRKRRRS